MTTPALPFRHVDAFTDVALRGNPAAVVVLDAPRDDTWLQAVAAEMNLPETAFLHATGDGIWSLRWCTPTVEVDLCGHATLASAHALWELGLVPHDASIAFDTRSGRLTATPRDARVELEFPALPTSPSEAPADALDALGIAAADLDFCGGDDDGRRLLVMRTAAHVRALTPDFTALGRFTDTWLVSAPSDDVRYDFVSRFFAPAHGIPEDPVTGSAHCTLAPYWSTRLGQAVVTGLQASARTGVVECEPRGERVLLRGHAVTVARGELVA